MGKNHRSDSPTTKSNDRKDSSASGRAMQDVNSEDGKDHTSLRQKLKSKSISTKDVTRGRSRSLVRRINSFTESSSIPKQNVRRSSSSRRMSNPKSRESN